MCAHSHTLTLTLTLTLSHSHTQTHTHRHVHTLPGGGVVSWGWAIPPLPTMLSPLNLDNMTSLLHRKQVDGSTVRKLHPGAVV